MGPYLTPNQYPLPNNNNFKSLKYPTRNTHSADDGENKILTEVVPSTIGVVVTTLTGNPTAGTLASSAIKIAANIDPENTTAFLACGALFGLASLGPPGWIIIAGWGVASREIAKQRVRDARYDWQSVTYAPDAGYETQVKKVEYKGELIEVPDFVKPDSKYEDYCVDNYLSRTYETAEGGTYTVDPNAG